MVKKIKRAPRGAIKKYLLQTFAILLFALSAAGLLYPLAIDNISKWYDNMLVERVTKAENAQIAAKKKEDALKLAEKERKLAVELKDPFSEASLNKASNVKRTTGFWQKHTIGAIYVPKIKVKLPIFDRAQEEFLQRGASWLSMSSYPGEGVGSHTVISGHRGQPSAELFINLDKLKRGDIFIIFVGEEYLAYQVDKISTVKPDDTSKIEKEAGRDLASLLTCTPYLINSHRLIVTGHRVPFKPNMLKGIDEDRRTKTILLILAAIALISSVLTVALSGLADLRRRRRRYTLKLISTLSVDFALFDKRNKNAVTLDGISVTLKPDNGAVTLRDISGGTYTLRVITTDGTHIIKAYIKKLKDEHFTLKLKGKKKDTLLLTNQNGIFTLESASEAI
ncbi:MAG: class C sortase [Streptococcaceae bacterium]|nr:class C sortase [Streptococcaceae bacterium]